MGTGLQAQSRDFPDFSAKMPETPGLPEKSPPSAGGIFAVRLRPAPASPRTRMADFNHGGINAGTGAEQIGRLPVSPDHGRIA
jgi:hypothetical protein